MLLLHQTGSVKIGEVVRYTVTYTPSADHILPSPEFLSLRIKNISAIALRAAFVHGPYTLSVAAYPSHFNPNEKFENPRRYGIPEFEPMLKAGAVWNCHLVVPDNIRQSAGEGTSKHGQFGNPETHGESVSWIIEVASQVIFSTSAAVHYEILLARDEKSLSLGSVVPVLGGRSQAPEPGQVSDFQQSIGSVKDHPAQPKGVFSRAIRLKVEDTGALWNTPRLPGWDEEVQHRAKYHGADAPVEPAVPTNKKHEEPSKPKKQKKVHLVVLTHGLHSNLGADMLFMKESIDAGVRKAKQDAKARRAKEWTAKYQRDTSSSAEEGGDRVTGDKDQPREDDGQDESDDEDDEEVIVRGFSGNATRTEKGIKYLGKRLAKFVLTMVFPEQPFIPTTRAASQAIVHSLKASKQDGEKDSGQKRPHSGSKKTDRSYKITKISFIAHSLGGLIQTYAIAYIQKHSPTFFDQVEPVNFIALASPFLGLNHENPYYVKFALDFGLVGRTGQDLGLTWRAPTIARNGFGAIISQFGENTHKHVYGEPQPESKPLLRILPTGPAHTALKKFRNRTVYSNVVNDGIVPLRTSCLLFLDWQGLGRVDKARREAGLVETALSFGWAELTGTNATAPRVKPWAPDDAEEKPGEEGSGDSTPTGPYNAHEVPQPPPHAMLEDDRASLRSAVVASPESEFQKLQNLQSATTSGNTNNPFSGIMNFFRSNETQKQAPAPQPSKANRIYQRSQILRSDDTSTTASASSSRSRVTTGNELLDSGESVMAPPKTTVFEAASDLINPKLPSVEYLIDPSKRPRAIFHDRIYHPSDIPPPPLKKRPTTSGFRRRATTSMESSKGSAGEAAPVKTPSSEASSPYSPTPGILPRDSSLSRHDYDDTEHTNPDMDPSEMVDGSQMQVEEKIARAYHRGLSWRKVLVKLEPDAHNNIIVRRQFANAFGWPVIQHLVEAHFSDLPTAKTPDDKATNRERAKPLSAPPDEHGSEVKDTETSRSEKKSHSRGGSTQSERDAIEAEDVVSGLPRSSAGVSSSDKTRGFLSSQSPSSPSGSLRDTERPKLVRRMDSVTWSDRDWIESGDESDTASESGQRDTKKDSFMGGLSPADKKGKSAAVTPSTSNSSDPAADSDPAKPGFKRSSTLNWNWTEKIVGKGALGMRPKSPRSSSSAGTTDVQGLGLASSAAQIIGRPVSQGKSAVMPTVIMEHGQVTPQGHLSHSKTG
ncbi:hypothetical protein SMACR_00861 [Sordaria macrospora]|uniref:WGS project CABT00000000 data, contig 2.2 n=2 Tax=Sordaria macrospora TaxID=5147 RepID=F7VNA3_SORMK|nr:uncharacterized protein SMAC_00861 [Sordaria macrospora k-hell]KAA8636656.1 hypothetical protein SMACR_00861 [Sordaria macrospora]KAH7630785.1 putative serine esterase-domain-containing protein [Sordaria sp. MPI-SDFR-AT-0083]WPJ62099.1 hypothetical protein SMAC4_00861 [Sordaria macrospora]CCC06832.1 unnamed protein product [Sordaria macrospora k-hell]